MDQNSHLSLDSSSSSLLGITSTVATSLNIGFSPLNVQYLHEMVGVRSKFDVIHNQKLGVLLKWRCLGLGRGSKYDLYITTPPVHYLSLSFEYFSFKRQHKWVKGFRCLYNSSLCPSTPVIAHFGYNALNRSSIKVRYDWTIL